MSIVHCHYCNSNIDTDYKADHFVEGTEHCVFQIEAAAPDLLEACKYVLTDCDLLSLNHKKALQEAINKATK